MGCCLTPEERQQSVVEKKLEEEKILKKSINKLLLLGSGGSGKSTLFKQLRTIHGQGFTEKDRLLFKDHIYSQVIDQLKILIRAVNEPTRENFENEEKLELSHESNSSAQFILNVRNDIDIDDVVSGHVELLWKDQAVRKAYQYRSRLKVDDSTSYFFDEVNRIGSKSYFPNEKDVLMVRHRTTGVAEQRFTVDGNTFHILDVGGQKSERKKWIHCFEYVKAVIFVSSLSAYNEVLFEDENINAMHDSIALFGDICNSPWFAEAHMILFLNKKDLFEEKLTLYPLTVCFENYYGSTKFDECLDFIKAQYESKNQNVKERYIFFHTTCATDKSNIARVFADLQHIVVTDGLERGGML